MIVPNTIARRFARDKRAVSAIEFALVLPVMLTLYLGGNQINMALSAYRKVTLTTRAVADLATQYSTVSDIDLANILGASAQVMAPFDTSSLSIVLTEFDVSAAGLSTVTWSKALNASALKQGSLATVPLKICQPGASVVLADVTYTYKPPIGSRLIGNISMSDHLYMAPRQVQSISYKGS